MCRLPGTVPSRPRSRSMVRTSALCRPPCSALTWVLSSLATLPLGSHVQWPLLLICVNFVSVLAKCWLRAQALIKIRCDFKSQNLIYTQTLSFSVFIRNQRNKSDCTRNGACTHRGKGNFSGQVLGGAALHFLAKNLPPQEVKITHLIAHGPHPEPRSNWH